MKELLLNVSPDPGQEARVAVAVCLARSLGGHINCLQSVALPVSVGDPSGVPPDVVEVLEEGAAELQKHVEARLDEAGVECSWTREFGDAAALAVSHSRLSDVVILSATGSYPSVGAVALNARTPVLAVPEGAQGFDVASPIVIAWNGSPPAANAMREVLPLIGAARSVHILTVDHDNEEFSAARSSEYLAHHSIQSEIHWRHSDGTSLAQSITDFAQQLGAGAVVAGAYGHNRIREMLLGSVTRELLRTSAIPLVLAH